MDLDHDHDWVSYEHMLGERAAALLSALGANAMLQQVGDEWIGALPLLSP